MTKAGIIPLSDIEWIRIHFNTRRRKSTKAGLKQLLQDTGGDLILNAAIFLKNGKPCCHLKADGAVKCAPNYNAWAISWNTEKDFGVRLVPSKKDANYMACVKCIIDGKKVAMDYQEDMKYATNRTAVGTKQGAFAWYCTEDNLSPEQLQSRLYDAGWDNAIMMDGGGSTCCMEKTGDGFAGDGRYIPFFLVIKRKETDKEPKGEKPMDMEIKAYSLVKEGNDQLTEHFRVYEFACDDGSDTVFVSKMLPVICEYVRMRCGAELKVNSGYRTPEHNKAVGGEEFSMHLYGCAADLKCPAGKTPKQMAGFAREVMPDWGGVGIYPWGIHVDVSPTKRDWNG